MLFVLSLSSEILAGSGDSFLGYRYYKAPGISGLQKYLAWYHRHGSCEDAWQREVQVFIEYHFVKKKTKRI